MVIVGWAHSRGGDAALRVLERSPPKIQASCLQLAQGEASLLAGDVDAYAGTETILTILAVRGAEDINYYSYLVVPPDVTLNFSELLPPQCTVSRCLPPCAQPREHERVHEHAPQRVWTVLQPAHMLTPASAAHHELCPVSMQVSPHVPGAQ